jgi:ankyrin repeat protein
MNMPLKYILCYLLAAVLISGCDGNTPLMKRVLKEDVQGTQELLSHGVDINARNNYGWTALMHAARLGNPELTRILLEHGAAVDAQNERHSKATPRRSRS